jgi:signal transduction histidine kinase
MELFNSGHTEDDNHNRPLEFVEQSQASVRHESINHDKSISDSTVEQGSASTGFRYLLLILMAVVIGSAIGYSFYDAVRINKIYFPLSTGAMVIKNELTTAHLLFEEIIGGDRSESKDRVWDHMAQAEWHASAMLHGGENEEWTFVSLEDPGLRLKIEGVLRNLVLFREIMMQRMGAMHISGSGTDIDQRCDFVFRTLIRELDVVEKSLHGMIARDMEKFKRTQIILIASSLILFLIVWIAFRRFDVQRLRDFLAVTKAKNKLEHEVHEREKVENNLRLNEERLRMLFELRQMNTASEKELTSFALEEVVRLTNSTVGYFHFFNDDQESLRLYMWSKEVLKECTAEKVSHYPLDQAGIWADCVRSGKPAIHNDYQNYPDKKGYPEGHFTILRHMSVPVFDDDKIVAVAGVGNKEEPYDGSDLLQLRLFMDCMWRVVKQKKSAEELKKSYKDLARSNKELEQFAYVASHDLQEPLRIVSSYVQLLARRYRGQLDSDADEFIKYAVDGAKRMQKLINDLLTYSRVSRGDEGPRVIDCKEVFHRVIANLKIAIEENDAVITHDDLPAITADEVQMVQLFQNLISNAIKFRGSGQPEIHLGVRQEKGGWRFSVTDNGIGLSPEYEERIFIIFQRLHGSDKYPGTGIGLAVCKKIVDYHGGRIWVESEPGEGSTFCFTIRDVD